VRWQVFRRIGKRGLVRVEATNHDRVRSKVLGCWFRSVGAERELRVRIASGAQGDDLVPTAEEFERAAKEQERADKEQARAETERERAEKEAALDRIRELEARLAGPTNRRRTRSR